MRCEILASYWEVVGILISRSGKFMTKLMSSVIKVSRKLTVEIKFEINIKMNCELMLTYDTPTYIFNVYKNQKLFPQYGIYQ